MRLLLRILALTTWLALSVITVSAQGQLYADTLKADTIKVNVRIVEVYATVFNRQQKAVDGLTRDDFQLLEDGHPQIIDKFESNEGAISCAILIDSTGSMASVLPHVRNSVGRLIEELGPKDSVAVYTFNTRLDVRQPFTTDKAKAKKAIFATRAEGRTALFDAIALAARETGKAQGKKALIVFTDGADNASALSATTATKTAREIGIPVYTIAEGDAVRTPELKKLLKDLSQDTGASTYEVKSLQDVDTVFDSVSRDLKHLYLLTYKPTASPSETNWRRISVSVKGQSDLHVRSKEGYFPN